MESLNAAIVVASALTVVGVLTSKLSSRIGVPALLLFLGVGMLAGSDGPGGIAFDNAELAQSLGVIALAFILFSGGLDTSWREARPVLPQGIALASVGVLSTAAIVGIGAIWILDVPLATGLLVGAIVSSTDAAAVFAVLRSRNIGLRRPIRPLLELESGSNDPMAVFLTIGFLELVTQPDSTALGMLPLFASQMAVGAAVGFGAGYLGVWSLNRIRLDYDGLYPVFALALVGATYGVAALLQGSGFLAVYIAGIIGSRNRFIHKQSLMRFLDGIAWVGQIGMFVVLGLLVFPSDLPDVALEGLLIAGILIFVARPIAVFLSLTPFRTPWREQALIGWVGLRGAAPIILATFPLMEGAEDADLIFDVVFFTVLTSVLIQGTTISLAARWLGVTEPMPQRTAWPFELVTPTPDGSELREVTVAAETAADGRAVVDLGLPAGTMIVLVRRDGSFAVPTGSTVLQSDDELLVLATPDGFQHLRQLAREPNN
ncbi:MAG: potassium/proton antiporter [Acidimicrobiales bacterium]